MKILKSSDIQNSHSGSLWEGIIHKRLQLLWFSCGNFPVFFFGCLWEVVTNERTGTKWRLDSESTVYYMYHWWSIPDSVTVVVSKTDHDALGKWCHYCVLLRLFGIKALRNTDSQLWLRMGRVLWVGEHVCDQVHVI